MPGEDLPACREIRTGPYRTEAQAGEPILVGPAKHGPFARSVIRRIFGQQAGNFSALKVNWADDDSDSGIGERTCQRIDPACRRQGIVIGKGDDLVYRSLYSEVPRSRRPGFFASEVPCSEGRGDFRYRTAIK